jgi:AAA domain
MHRDIASFLSRRFHGRDLCSECIFNQPSLLLLHCPSSIVCIDNSAFIRRDGGQTEYSEACTQVSVLQNSNIFGESARGTGYMNEGEASLTANTLQRLLQLNEGLEQAEISVITPYVELKRAILDKLRNFDHAARSLLGSPAQGPIYPPCSLGSASGASFEGD